MVIYRYAIAVALAASLAGCGGKEEGSVAKQAGKAVGEAAMDFGSGVKSAVDTKLTVPVELSEDMSKKGLSKTVAKSLSGTSSSNKGISVYLLSLERYDGNLLAKAIDDKDQEIGRATIDVVFEPHDAKYVTFIFPKEMDTALAAKYVLDVQERPPAPPSNSSNPQSPIPNP
ncbi:MAG TPA: hypothetical protein VJL29_08120 [Thermoguttaceae bacterium]|nr:hypothetical protein [Thermoguttaceae bacterium]